MIIIKYYQHTDINITGVPQHVGGIDIVVKNNIILVLSLSHRPDYKKPVVTSPCEVTNKATIRCTIDTNNSILI